MIKIYKYPLEVIDMIEIQMPEDAVILSVQSQMGLLQLWAEVDTEKELTRYTFMILGTGHVVPVPSDQREYIGTVQHNGFVWHIYLID